MEAGADFGACVSFGLLKSGASVTVGVILGALVANVAHAEVSPTWCFQVMHQGVVHSRPEEGEQIEREADDRHPSS